MDNTFPDAAGQIVLAGTPIGNLADATPRLKEYLASADIIAAEDTRNTAALARRLGITITGQLVSHHEFNEKQSAPELIHRARNGETILLVSDAGMPTVSDPGFQLAREAIAEGITVTCAPGASAVTTALAVSGLPSDRFAFEGFPPKKSGAKQKFFEELAGEKRTLIFFESPHRVADTLRTMSETFGFDRQACVARELTKLHEEVVRDTLEHLIEWAESKEVRGEIVLLTEGFTPSAVGIDEQLEEVRALVDNGMRLKDATKEVAAKYKSKARELYNRLN